jgi:hypothetical protein
MKAISDQQLAVSGQPSGYKIQVMAVDLPNSKGLPWADMGPGMPEFVTYEDAQIWMSANGCEKLQEFGLRFRIMPKDFPCELIAQLEKDGATLL